MTERKQEEMLLNLKKMEVIKWDKSTGNSADTAYLTVEEPLAIEINGHKAAVLMRLPGSEKELAVGFCVSEGLIEHFNDILLVHHCGSFQAGQYEAAENLESRNMVRLLTSKSKQKPGQQLEMLLVRSGCGRNNVEEISTELPVVTSKLRVKAETIGRMSAALSSLQEVKRISGGLHSAAIFAGDLRVVAHYEDVGRHNAMDKAIGYALLHDITLDDKIVFITGRTSYEMVTKAARTGVPVLVSLSSPTSLAVEFAEVCGITLVGYVRQSKLVVYTCPERIVEF